MAVAYLFLNYNFILVCGMFFPFDEAFQLTNLSFTEFTMFSLPPMSIINGKFTALH